MNPTKIFVSYSHKDVDTQKKVIQHLDGLAAKGILDLWVDTRIQIGDSWLDEIKHALDEAQMAILLVSPAFLASPFIKREEIPVLLQKRAESGLRLLPIVIRGCYWQCHSWLNPALIFRNGEVLSLGRAGDVQLAQFAADVHKLVQAQGAQTPNPNRLRAGQTLDNNRNFWNNSAYQSQILDIGAAFTHRKKSDLTLLDVFVPPRLVENNYSKKTQSPVIIDGQNLIKQILTAKRLVITAPEKGGKTSLARHFYVSFLDLGFVPIFIDGGRITDDTSDVSDLIHREFCDQYSEDQYEKFKAQEKGKKVLIIDDFSLCTIDGKAAILEQLCTNYEIIVVFSHEFFQLEGFTRPNSENNYLLGFSHFEIMEFDHAMQEKLINQWVALGTSSPVSEELISHQTKTIHKHIDTVTGKNLLPSYPFVILSILQTFENEKPLAVTSGTYGFFYELLISKVLLQMKVDLSLDGKYSFLAQLGYFVYKSKGHGFSKDDIRTCYSVFHKEFAIAFDIEMFITELHRVNIIKRVGTGFEFRYPYYYYYSAARYMSVRIGNQKHTSQIHLEIDEMCDHLYKEDCANVMIMFCYLSKDSYLTGRLIVKARSLFESYSECNFDEDSEFLDGLFRSIHVGIPPVLIEDVVKSRQKAKRDRANLSFDSKETSPMPIIDEHYNTFLEMNVGLKTLQILGQALRNFSGSLDAEVKTEMAIESYKLGLRILRFVLKYVEKNIPIVTRVFVEVLIKRELERNDSEHIDPLDTMDWTTTSEITQRMVLGVTLGWAFRIIKNISAAVGAEDLKEIYDRVLNHCSTTAFRLTNHCIQTDHFKHIDPDMLVEELDKLGKKKSSFAIGILRKIVLDYLLLSRPNNADRHVLCDNFGIKWTNPKFAKPDSQRSLPGGKYP